MKNQSTLLNFKMFSLVKALSSKLELSQSNILHTQKENCPTCGNLCVYNGYSHEGNYSFDAKSSNSFFKIGQQYCKYCDKTITKKIPEFEELNQILENELKNVISSPSRTWDVRK